MDPAIREYLARIGRKGGKAGKGRSDMGDIARAAWADLTPAERSAEMKRRIAKRKGNRRAGVGGRR